jgi:aminoglycoside phosphotransferase (APT) family kinase protein
MPDGHTAGIIPRLPADLGPLESWLEDKMAARKVSVRAAVLLPGGAVQRNWRLDIDADGQVRPLVLRVGPDLPLPESLSKDQEFEVLQHVHAAGVPVPTPLWVEPTETLIGRAFLVSEFSAGDADRQKLFARPDNDSVLLQLGSALAQTHGAGIPAGLMPETPRDRVETLQEWACGLESLPCGLIAGLDWLDVNAPEPVVPTLVHRDFRTGNFLIADDRLVAVLDWEFAGAGDPLEDIGWFCAACWRGDNPTREAGGLGERPVFLTAYAKAGGQTPEPESERIYFWEVFAHIRWALIAMQQALRAAAGEYPDWELKEAGNRVPGLSKVISKMVSGG